MQTTTIQFEEAIKAKKFEHVAIARFDKLRSHELERARATLARLVESALKTMNKTAGFQAIAVMDEGDDWGRVYITAETYDAFGRDGYDIINLIVRSYEEGVGHENHRIANRI